MSAASSHKEISIPKRFIPFIVIALVLSILIPIYGLVRANERASYDLERIAHITLIAEKMKEFQELGEELPMPGGAIHLYIGDQLYGYQGVVNEKIFRQLGLKVVTDPETKKFYDYFYRPDTKTYELLAKVADQQYSNEAYDFYPQSFNKGISHGNFIVANTGDEKGSLIHHLANKGAKINLLNKEKRDRLNIFVGSSCKDILNKQPGAGSGVYLAQIAHQIFPVYCDMTTDGGGWTLFYANHGHQIKDSEKAMSYVQMREKVLTDGEVLQIADYDNPELAGLLDYRHFIEQEAKEIIITNRIGDKSKWVKTTFSHPRTLQWALSDAVLGKTNEGCLDLGRNQTWSITNHDGTIEMLGLKQMMNHRGTSWGVSHDKHWCNDQFKARLSHLGFYVATGTSDAQRARSAQGISGKWGGENEYRYFIR